MVAKILNCFNLYQPWADAVVEGRLPVLIRRINTSYRGRVGVASTQGMDAVVLCLLIDQDLLGMAEKRLVFDRAIGTVSIDSTMPVKGTEVLSRLSEMVTKREFEFYPYHLIPRDNRVYFWVLSKQRRFSKPILLKSKGIVWSKAIEHRSGRMFRGTSFWQGFPEKRYVDSNKRLRKQRVNDHRAANE